MRKKALIIQYKSHSLLCGSQANESTSATTASFGTQFTPLSAVEPNNVDMAIEAILMANLTIGAALKSEDSVCAL